MKGPETSRRVRKRRVSSRSLSPWLREAIQAVERAKGVPPTEEKHFQYVLVQIKDADPSEIMQVYSKVVQCFSTYQAMARGDATLLTAYLGLMDAKEDSTEARTSLVAALLAENGRAVRVVHGQCSGPVGNFGGPKRWNDTAIIPNFSAVLNKLVEIEFGTAAEIP
jgi:hypothetical protein